MFKFASHHYLSIFHGFVLGSSSALWPMQRCTLASWISPLKPRRYRPLSSFLVWFDSANVCLADQIYGCDVMQMQFSSASMKEAIDELEQKLQECHKKQAEEEAVAHKASVVTARAAKRAGAGAGAAAGAGKAKRQRATRAGDHKKGNDSENDDSEAEVEEEEEEEEASSKKKAPAKASEFWTLPYSLFCIF
jgi:hypothetical protein